MKKKHIALLIALAYLACWGGYKTWDLSHLQRSNKRIASFIRWRLDKGIYISDPNVCREPSESEEVSRRRGAYLQSYESLPFSYEDSLIHIDIPSMRAFLEYEQWPNEKGDSLVNLLGYYDLCITDEGDVKTLQDPNTIWRVKPSRSVNTRFACIEIFERRFLGESHGFTVLDYNPSDTLRIPLVTYWKYIIEGAENGYDPIPLGEWLFVPVP